MKLIKQFKMKGVHVTFNDYNEGNYATVITDIIDFKISIPVWNQLFAPMILPPPNTGVIMKQYLHEVMGETA